jgi:hypothetical protein
MSLVSNAIVQLTGKQYLSLDGGQCCQDATYEGSSGGVVNKLHVVCDLNECKLNCK